MGLDSSPPPAAPRSLKNIALWLVVLAAVLVAAIAGGRLIMQATHEGPGLSPDTRGYLEMARSLLSGHGLRHYNGDFVLVPATHFPPMYSVVLAGMMRLGIEFEHGVRWLNVGLFAATALLVALIVARCVPPKYSLIAALFGGILCALSPVMVHVYCMAWSEPLFFPCALAMILWLGIYLERTDRRWLIAAAVVLSLAVITRYAAVSLVLAAGIAILSGGRRRVPMRRRIVDTVIFGVIACMPLAVLVVRNIALTGKATDRQVALHPLASDDLQMSIVTLADWFAPTSDKPLLSGQFPKLESFMACVAVVMAAGAWVICFVLRKRKKPEDRSGALSLLLWFTPLYILFLVVSMTWLDAATDLDFRILCPLYLAVQIQLITAAFGLFELMHAHGAAVARWGIVVFAIALGVYESVRTFQWSFAMRRHGLGYNSRVWRYSQVTEFAKTIPANSVIYTNAPDAVYLLLGRLSKSAPKTFLPGSVTEVGLHRAFNNFRKDMAAHDGYLVMFNTVSREYMVSEDRMRQRFQLQAAFTGKDGVVYRLPDAAPVPTTTPSTLPSTNPVR